MVSTVTTPWKSGLQEWLVQRISAIILTAYSLFLLGFYCYYPNIDFQIWYNLFQCLYFKIFTSFAIVAIIAHAWIGIWIVMSDYIKLIFIRLPLQVIINIWLVINLVWGIHVVWSLP